MRLFFFLFYNLFIFVVYECLLLIYLPFIFGVRKSQVTKVIFKFNSSKKIWCDNE